MIRHSFRIAALVAGLLWTGPSAADALAMVMPHAASAAATAPEPCDDRCAGKRAAASTCSSICAPCHGVTLTSPPAPGLPSAVALHPGWQPAAGGLRPVPEPHPPRPTARL